MIFGTEKIGRMVFGASAANMMCMDMRAYFRRM